VTSAGYASGSPSPRLGLKARLQAGEGLTGLILKMPAPVLAEIAGYAGLDLIVLDTEHGPSDGGMLEHHLRAASAVGIPAVVRVAGNDPVYILQALDGGAAGVIVPHVDTAAQAAAATRAAHYPPFGTRGFALSTRAGSYGAVSAREHLRAAEQNTLVIAQIEDIAAVPHIQAIAAIPRLDALWVGPGDLSLSLGRPGEPAHPDVTAAIDKIVAHTQSASSPRLCVLARDEHEARTWRRRGAAITLFSAVDVITARLAAIAADAARDALPARLREAARSHPDGMLRPAPQPETETQ
jgi:4-hydroxy-2-oxoheptanedioate aldolase